MSFDIRLVHLYNIKNNLLTEECKKKMDEYIDEEKSRNKRIVDRQRYRESEIEALQNITDKVIRMYEDDRMKIAERQATSAYEEDMDRKYNELSDDDFELYKELNRNNSDDDDWDPNDYGNTTFLDHDDIDDYDDDDDDN